MLLILRNSSKGLRVIPSCSSFQTLRFMSGGGGDKAKKVKEPPLGIVFPVTDPAKGTRSSLVTAKEIFAASAAAVDQTTAERARAEKKWRFGYPKHVVGNLALSARSEQAALKVSQAGLDKLYDVLEFIKPDGQVIKIKEAMQSSKGTFGTHTIKGTKPRPDKLDLKVPYKVYHTNEFKELRGEEIIKQVNKWVSRGTIEPDCGEAIKEVVRNPGWMDLSDQTFVLLGATSAMGPFNLLKELGAHIIAIDIDRPHLWKKMIEAIQDSHASITFPLRSKFEGQSGDALYNMCGGNLLTEAPEIANWLCSTVPAIGGGKKVTVGSYTYLDGDKHVRVSMACDAIISRLIDTYGPTNLRMATLSTPTDVYLVSDSAASAARANLSKAPWWMKALQAIAAPMNRLIPNVMKPFEADDCTVYNVNDGLLDGQGPNYALAKRLQQWRAVLARKQGVAVSINIAPATATASVLSNKTFQAAYGGMHVFEPIEIFHEACSQYVMGALLIYDLRSPFSVANANVPLKNPFLLFSRKAFHGGVFRCLYKFGTIGETAVLINYCAPKSVKNPAPKKKKA